MKKTIILALAALACIMSCTKESSSEEPTPTPTPQIDSCTVEFVLAAFTDQSQFVDQSFSFTVGWKTVSFKLSEMTEITDKTNYSLFDSAIENAMILSESTKTYKLYKYTLGTIGAGQSVFNAKKTYAVVDGRPSQETFDFLEAFTFNVSEGFYFGSKSAVVYSGIGNTDINIASWCSFMSVDITDLTFSFDSGKLTI